VRTVHEIPGVQRKSFPESEMGVKMSSPIERPLDPDSELLNSCNLKDYQIPKRSDVVVVGGGIHSLIYAIHVKEKELQNLGGQCCSSD
jgi:hypothetical protein